MSDKEKTEARARLQRRLQRLETQLARMGARQRKPGDLAEHIARVQARIAWTQAMIVELG